MVHLCLPNTNNYLMPTNKQLGHREFHVVHRSFPHVDYYMPLFLLSQGHKTMYKLIQANCLENRLPSYVKILLNITKNMDSGLHYLILGMLFCGKHWQSEADRK